MFKKKLKKPQYLSVDTPRAKITILNKSSGKTKLTGKFLISEMKQIKARYDSPQDMEEGDRERIQEIRHEFRENLTKVVYELEIILKKYGYRRYASFTHKNNIPLREEIKKEINRTIAEYRANRQQQHLEYPIEIKGELFRMKGNNRRGERVFSIPGQIAELAVKRKLKELFEPKKPQPNIKYVGIELEFCATISEIELAKILFNAGYHKFLELKKDGSLRPKEKENGFELAILLPEVNYKKYLRGICNILTTINAQTDDRRCGLHVHLDMRKRKKDVVYSNLVSCQNILLKIVDPKRTDNEFCRFVESRKFPTKFNGSREERYKTINAASYYKYNTIEVRMHQGSVQFKDIAHWADLLIQISNYKTKIKNDIYELTILKKRFKLDKRMEEFLQDKVCFWQVQQGTQMRSTSRPSSNRLSEINTLNTQLRELDTVVSRSVSFPQASSSWVVSSVNNDTREVTVATRVDNISSGTSLTLQQAQPVINSTDNN